MHACLVPRKSLRSLVDWWMERLEWWWWWWWCTGGGCSVVASANANVSVSQTEFVCTPKVNALQLLPLLSVSQLQITLKGQSEQQDDGYWGSIYHRNELPGVAPCFKFLQASLPCCSRLGSRIREMKEHKISEKGKISETVWHITSHSTHTQRHKLAPSCTHRH